MSIVFIKFLQINSMRTRYNSGISIQESVCQDQVEIQI